MAADPALTYHFTTKHLPSADQFEAWRHFTAPVVGMSLVEPEENGFPADQSIWDLGTFVFTDATLPGDGCTRRWQHLKKDPLDHWCLVLPSGSRHDGAASTAADGGRHIGFRSLARPFEGAGSDSRVLTLFIPRDLFGGTASLLDAVPTSIPDTGLGRVLADYMCMLAERLPTLTAAEQAGLAEATRAMVAACLVPTADRLANAADPIAVTFLERARQLIRANLRARDLGPERLCRQLGVSRSRLYRLFEPLGGVMRYIQRQRLLAAHAALSNVDDTQHIVQIAESCGFVDASGFSRAFRQEFGYTPREARDAAWAGVPRSPPPMPRPPGVIGDLGAMLHRLGA